MPGRNREMQGVRSAEPGVGSDQLAGLNHVAVDHRKHHARGDPSIQAYFKTASIAVGQSLHARLDRQC